MATYICATHRDIEVIIEGKITIIRVSEMPPPCQLLRQPWPREGQDGECFIEVKG